MRSCGGTHDQPPPGQQPPPKTPVMADVARLAGVSRQTVSRVINGQANIRPDTRARVEEAIRWLGYRPNTAARALGPTSIRRTIEQAARAANYFVSSVNLESVTRGHLADAVEHLLGQSARASS